MRFGLARADILSSSHSPGVQLFCVASSRSQGFQASLGVSNYTRKLNSIAADFARTNSNSFIEIGDEDLPIPDLPCLSSL